MVFLVYFWFLKRFSRLWCFPFISFAPFYFKILKKKTITYINHQNNSVVKISPSIWNLFYIKNRISHLPGPSIHYLCDGQLFGWHSLQFLPEVSCYCIAVLVPLQKFMDSFSKYNGCYKLKLDGFLIIHISLFGKRHRLIVIFNL